MAPTIASNSLSSGEPVIPSSHISSSSPCLFWSMCDCSMKNVKRVEKGKRMLGVQDSLSSVITNVPSNDKSCFPSASILPFFLPSSTACDNPERQQTDFREKKRCKRSPGEGVVSPSKIGIVNCPWRFLWLKTLAKR